MAFMASGGYKGIGAQVPNVKVCFATLVACAQNEPVMLLCHAAQKG